MKEPRLSIQFLSRQYVSVISKGGRGGFLQTNMCTVCVLVIEIERNIEMVEIVQDFPLIHCNEKSLLCFPFLRIARPQSQFPYSCVCERFIYFQEQSTYFPTREQADRSWKYINLSQIYECRNWETEHYNSVQEITVSFLGINGYQAFILDSHRPFICSVGRTGTGRIHCNKNLIYVFLFWELCGLSPNFHIHVSVSELYIPRIGPHISCSRIGTVDRSWECINRSQTHECRNWDCNRALPFLRIYRMFRIFGIDSCSVSSPWSIQMEQSYVYSPCPVQPVRYLCGVLISPTS